MSADLYIFTFDPNILDPEIIREVERIDGVLGETEIDQEWLKLSDQASDLTTFIYDIDFSKPNPKPKYDGNVWVGQVSYLKHGTDGLSYVPESVWRITKLYQAHGGVVVITPGFVAEVMNAFNLKSNSVYEAKVDRDGVRIPNRYRGVSKARTVKRFLEANMGRHTFTSNI